MFNKSGLSFLEVSFGKHTVGVWRQKSPRKYMTDEEKYRSLRSFTAQAQYSSTVAKYFESHSGVKFGDSMSLMGKEYFFPEELDPEILQNDISEFVFEGGRIGKKQLGVPAKIIEFCNCAFEADLEDSFNAMFKEVRHFYLRGRVGDHTDIVAKNICNSTILESLEVNDEKLLGKIVDFADAKISLQNLVVPVKNDQMLNLVYELLQKMPKLRELKLIIQEDVSLNAFKSFIDELNNKQFSTLRLRMCNKSLENLTSAFQACLFLIKNKQIVRVDLSVHPKPDYDGFAFINRHKLTFAFAKWLVEKGVEDISHVSFFTKNNKCFVEESRYKYEENLQQYFAKCSEDYLAGRELTQAKELQYLWDPNGGMGDYKDRRDERVTDTVQSPFCYYNC